LEDQMGLLGKEFDQVRKSLVTLRQEAILRDLSRQMGVIATQKEHDSRSGRSVKSQAPVAARTAVGAAVIESPDGVCDVEFHRGGPANGRTAGGRLGPGQGAAIAPPWRGPRRAAWQLDRWSSMSDLSAMHGLYFLRT